MDTYNVHAPSVVAHNIIRDIRDVRGMTIAAFARSIGKTPQNVYNMLRGESRFSKKTAKLLNERYKYSILYLTQGIGQLYENAEDNPRFSDYPFHENDPDEETQRKIEEAVGVFYSTGKNLTKRERLLNEYALKFVHLFEETNLTIVGRDYTDAFSEADKLTEELGFKARSPKEWSIFKAVLLNYSMIKCLLDPAAILKELDAIEE